MISVGETTNETKQNLTWGKMALRRLYSILKRIVGNGEKKQSEIMFGGKLRRKKSLIKKSRELCGWRSLG